MPLETEIQALTEALDRNSRLLEKLTGKAEAAAVPKAKAEAKAEAKSESSRPVGRPRKAEAEKDEREERSRARAAESAPEATEALSNYVKKYLNFGDQDSADDENERDRRTNFVKRMLRHLDVDRVSDIPGKSFGTIKRWILLDEDGAKVDFETD